MSILMPPLAAKRSSLLATPPSAVLWLPGQDDAYSATIRDRSGKANNGAITGATWAQTAQGVWYLDYSGTDQYVNCGSDTSLDFGTSDFSISLWINADTLPVANNDFLGKYQAATDAWGFRFSVDQLRFAAVVANVVVLLALTTPTYTTGVWRKVTYTCDRDGSQYIYVNGVSQALATDTQSSDGVTLTNTGALYWGVNGSLLTNDFNGKMTLQAVTKAFTPVAAELTNFQLERSLFGV